MDFQLYLSHFDEILNSSTPFSPYDDKDFMEYTKLNRSRINRWLKQGVIEEILQAKIKAIHKPQTWVVITEPWCGDAAHIVPFIDLTARLNPLIKVNYELRDAAPFRIEQYLTDGSKSIPILIVYNENEKELFKWGPRPQKAHNLYLELKKQNLKIEEIKLALQNWYNADKGISLQQELLALPD